MDLLANLDLGSILLNVLLALLALLIIVPIVSTLVLSWKNKKRVDVGEEDIVSITQVKKSVKSYTCSGCGKPIPSGSEYIRVSYRDGDGLGSVAYHGKCK